MTTRNETKPTRSFVAPSPFFLGAVAITVALAVIGVLVASL
jgi:hypothetical protein